MNTKEPFVITISRVVGSGGHTVGKILAEKLETRSSSTSPENVNVCPSAATNKGV